MSYMNRKMIVFCNEVPLFNCQCALLGARFILGVSGDSDL